MTAEFFSLHVVNRIALRIQGRQSGVWFGDNGNDGNLRHAAHRIHHLVRPRGTVCPHRRNAKTLQNNRRSNRIGAKQRPAVRLKGKSRHHSQIADLLRRDHGRPRLLQAHHRLYYQQIHTRLDKITDLFLIYLNQLLKIQFSHRSELFACHGQVTRNIRFPADRLS